MSLRRSVQKPPLSALVQSCRCGRFIEPLMLFTAWRLGQRGTRLKLTTFHNFFGEETGARPRPVISRVIFESSNGLQDCLEFWSCNAHDLKKKKSLGYGEFSVVLAHIGTVSMTWKRVNKHKTIATSTRADRQTHTNCMCCKCYGEETEGA